MTDIELILTQTLACVGITIAISGLVIFLSFVVDKYKREELQEYASSRTCQCGHSNIDHSYNGLGYCTYMLAMYEQCQCLAFSGVKLD